MEKQDTENMYASLNDPTLNHTPEVAPNSNPEETFMVTKDELEAIKEEFLAERQKLEDEKWLELNLAKFETLLIENRPKDLTTFAQSIIHHLANTFGAETIVFFNYQTDTQVLSIEASTGISIESIEKKVFDLGEGLIGQVAKSKETFTLVQGVSQLIIYPLVFEETLQAIIEINFQNKPIPKSQILLQKLLESSASAIYISKSSPTQTTEPSAQEKKTLVEEQVTEEDLKVEMKRLRYILIEKQNDEKTLLQKIASQKEEVYEALEKMKYYESEQHTSHQVAINEVLVEKEKEFNKLKEDLEWKIAEIERQDNAISHKNKLIEEAEKQVEKLKQENHKQVEEIVVASKSFKEIEQDMNLMRSRHKQELENHQEIIKSLQTKNQELEKNHQQDIQKVQDDWSVSVQERIIELQEKSVQLANVEETLTKVQTEAENTQKQFEEFKIDQQKTVLEFEDSMAQKDFQIEEYKKEIVEIQQVLNERLNLEEKLKAAISLKSDEIKQLKQSIKQTESTHLTSVVNEATADTTTSEARVKELETELVQKEQTIMELSQHSSSNQPPINIQDLQDQLTQQESSYHFIEEELEKRNQENIHLEQALNELREKLYDREKKIEELKNKQEGLEKQPKEVSSNNITDKNKKTHKSQAQVEKLEYLMWKNTALMSFNLEAEILEINDLFANIFEYSIEELKDQSLDMLVEKNYTTTDEYKRLWYNIAKGHEAQINAFKIITKNQETKELNISFTPIFGSMGDIEKILTLIQEPHISTPKPEVIEKVVEVEKVIEVEKIVEVEKKASNKEHTDISKELLHEQVEKLKAVDNSFLILELDTEGLIIGANSQFLRFLGYDLEDIQGRAHRLLIDPEDRKNDNYIEILKRAQEGSFSNKNFKYIGKEGEYLNLISHFNPIKDIEGEVRTILILSQLAKYSS